MVEGADAALTALAADAVPFRSLSHPAADEFIVPEHMPRQMAGFCRRTGQPEPATEAEFVRCAFDSLALLYGRTLRQLEMLARRRIEVLHVAGGGSRNDLLNQMTADATGIPVIAGPAEAVRLAAVRKRPKPKASSPMAALRLMSG